MGHTAQFSDAFTLIEMIVVISIILIILGLALPAAQSLWEERKASEAENTLQGLFMTARAKAVAEKGLTGLFFFVDGQGVQKIVTIADVGPQDLKDQLGNKCPPWDPSDPSRPGVYDDVYEVTDEQTHVLPAPMRVVPRYVVDQEQTGVAYKAFSPEELVSDQFEPPAGDFTQRHRNYFAMIFNDYGQLRAGHNVLIRDVDQDLNGFGDRTGLTVGDGPCPGDATTTQYYTREGVKQNIDPVGGATPEAVPFLITDGGDFAINFPSVDGLMVYDESAFGSLPDQSAPEMKAKRDLLLRTAQPIYISRWTGVVIRGPLGENMAPEP